jgi:hypothetical protein
MPDDRFARAFKTAWFSKAVCKARIRDGALMQAVREAMRGQADDLGGGVFKKRLNDNQHRSILLAKGGKLWVFAFLYAKKDRANIDPDELMAFRKLAQAYGRISPSELEQALKEGDLLELSDDH